jgi:hypothetical protein
MRRFAALLVAATLVCWGNFARADEDDVPLDKLPAKVTAAVKAKFPKAELVAAQKEVEDGKTLYEVGIKNEGQKIEVTALEDGTIVEVEKEITFKDLPKAVSDVMDTKYPKAEIKKVEEITEGTKVAYELLFVTADKKKLEIKFDKDGKVLESEDKSDDKDDK